MLRNVWTWACALALGCLLAGCPTDDDDDDVVELTCPGADDSDRDFSEQVLIPAGEFVMGSEYTDRPDAYWPAGDESPPHPVQLDAFCMDKYEVSLRRYEDCVDDGVCPPDGLEHEQREVQTVVNHYPDDCWPDRENCFDHAVNAKNYWQAQTFCAYSGRRLCTEAEWERAASGPGPDKPRHPWGDEAPNSDLVNIPSTGTGYVEAVDDYEAGQSAEGVLNMAGNVYEWVRDQYEAYEPAPNGEALDNPHNPPSFGGAEVVGRGSCFFTEPEETVTERSVFPMDFDWG